MIQALILDFDGVVLESVEVKTLAFKALFSHEASFPMLIVYSNIIKITVVFRATKSFNGFIAKS